MLMGPLCDVMVGDTLTLVMKWNVQQSVASVNLIV